jgi:hypothetical protein
MSYLLPHIYSMTKRRDRENIVTFISDYIRGSKW